MKLLLYSGFIPLSSSRYIRRLIPKRSPKILIIPSDSGNPQVGGYIAAYQTQFMELGFGSIDIYKYDQFDTYQTSTFDTYDAVFLSGGDTQYFWDGLLKTQTDKALREYVSRGGVLMGLSAGSMIMMSHLSFDTGSPGLNLISGYFYPHFQAGENAELLALSGGISDDVIYALPDDSFIVVEDESLIIEGPHTCFHKGVVL